MQSTGNRNVNLNKTTNRGKFQVLWFGLFRIVLITDFVTKKRNNPKRKLSDKCCIPTEIINAEFDLFFRLQEECKALENKIIGMQSTIESLKEQIQDLKESHRYSTNIEENW